jgi:hypothetical protein
MVLPRRYRPRGVGPNFVIKVGPVRVVIPNMTEIVKPYGRKMEDLCHVRDACETRRGHHHIENGW